MSHLWVTTTSVPVPKWKKKRSDSCASVPQFLTPISLHSHKNPFKATGSEVPAITRGRKKSSVIVFFCTLSTAIFGSVVCNQIQQDEKLCHRLFAYTKLGDFWTGCLQSHAAGWEIPSSSLCVHWTWRCSDRLFTITRGRTKSSIVVPLHMVNSTILGSVVCRSSTCRAIRRCVDLGCRINEAGIRTDCSRKMARQRKTPLGSARRSRRCFD